MIAGATIQEAEEVGATDANLITETMDEDPIKAVGEAEEDHKLGDQVTWTWIKTEMS
jgi:hypothetical protein